VAYNAATATQLWAKRYTGPAGLGGDAAATSQAVSPSGGTVYVTGSRDAANLRPNYATIAYSG